MNIADWLKNHAATELKFLSHWTPQPCTCSLTLSMAISLKSHINKEYYFTARNSMPGHVGEAETLGVSKTRLDTVIDAIYFMY